MLLDSGVFNLLEVLTVDEARDKIISTLKDHGYGEGKIGTEIITSESALDRVLAESLQAAMDLPPFSRSTVDGYAVRAEDTYGTSESFPGIYKVVGKVLMGEQPRVKAGKDDVVEIATGGMLPQEADAVVMIEETESFSEDSILINAPVSPGENVIKAGEDVVKGEKVFEKGQLIRKQDIGALAALGITEILVYKQPKIGIVSTGDEVVEPSRELSPGKIRDINSWALKSTSLDAGAVPLLYGISPDDKDELMARVKKAVSETDLVIISGGSSVGERDVSYEVIDSLGKETGGVIFHGISIKPGKPTIFGMVDDKPVFGLSGNPVSAMVTFELFVKEGINVLKGQKRQLPTPTIRGTLTRNLSSKGGREDYVRVKLEKDAKGNIKVVPVLGEAGLIFTLTEADGLIRIPQNTEGIMSGEEVEVYIF